MRQIIAWKMTMDFHEETRPMPVREEFAAVVSVLTMFFLAVSPLPCKDPKVVLPFSPKTQTRCPTNPERNLLTVVTLFGLHHAALSAACTDQGLAKYLLHHSSIWSSMSFIVSAFRKPCPSPSYTTNLAICPAFSISRFMSLA